MSFNRGAKRNAFGNRNFNRSGGGGGGGGGNQGGRNNVGMGMGGGGGGVNPWESGVMPGRGLLPTPNNNLNLSSPQAQLVIASNLLSNLLRTQQEVQPQVPSLLSLGNNMNGPGGNFGGQPNFGPSGGRFNDRAMRHPMKNQRPQPYNKMGNRARDGAAGRRGPSAQQSHTPQSANQRMNGNRNDKSSKANQTASKQNQTVKKEQQDVKTSDKEKIETHVAKSDESEAGEEKKRDWKDEKNKEGDANQTEVSEEKKETTEDDTEKPATTDKKPEDGQASGKKSASRHAESRYSAVPMSHMFCHVCNKHMWDGFSFENHLRGRAHQLMMDKLDESYKLKVDLMRHELRVAEEQRELTLANSKRRGKKVPVDLNVREYCTMCDLNFFGTLSSHRKSDKHQQLKTFLHPRCFPCGKEFPSRIEYDEHCLTPGHMKNSAQNEEQRKNKKKDKLAKGESEVRTAEDEEKDSGPPESAKAADKDEELAENTEYIIDITEDMTMTDHKIPSLKYCRFNQILLGKSMIKEVQGYHCEKCRRFMITEADMSAHLRSVTHYRNFVQEVKALTATPEVPAKVETAETPETEETIATDETNSTATTTTKVDNKEETVKEEDDDDYEGDWKRRKIEDTNDETEMETEKVENANNETAETKTVDGTKKYDPMEADVESEDDAKANAKMETSNVEISPEKGAMVEKMWADVDDDDTEIGNLIDDDGDEKEQLPPSTPQQPQQVQAQVQQPEPEKVQAVQEASVEVPATPETKVAEPPTTPSPQVKSSPVVNTPPSSGKSQGARGSRGYGRGRGTPRARRSRR